MPEMTAHIVGDPSFLHACVVEPSYKLPHDLRTKPAEKTFILDPSLRANIPVADLGGGGGVPRELAPHPPQAHPTGVIFRPNWGPKSWKKNFSRCLPPLSQGLDDLAPPFSEGLDLSLHSITCSQLHAVTHNKEKVGSSSQALMAL